MQNSPILDKPLPLISFVLYQIFEVLQFSDKLKPLCNGLFKNLSKPMKVSEDLMKEDGRTFHKHRNHIIACFHEKPLPFPHIQSYKEQNPEINHKSATSDMRKNFLYTSYNNSEIDENVFDDDTFRINDDDQSIMFNNEI